MVRFPRERPTVGRPPAGDIQAEAQPHSGAGHGLHELERQLPACHSRRGAHRLPGSGAAVRRLRGHSGRTACAHQAGRPGAARTEHRPCGEPGRHGRPRDRRSPGRWSRQASIREGITHVIFGQSSRNRMEILVKGSHPQPIPGGSERRGRAGLNHCSDHHELPQHERRVHPRGAAGGNEDGRGGRHQQDRDALAKASGSLAPTP